MTGAPGAAPELEQCWGRWVNFVLRLVHAELGPWVFVSRAGQTLSGQQKEGGGQSHQEAENEEPKNVGELV